MQLKTDNIEGPTTGYRLKKNASCFFEKLLKKKNFNSEFFRFNQVFKIGRGSIV